MSFPLFLRGAARRADRPSRLAAFLFQTRPRVDPATFNTNLQAPHRPLTCFTMGFEEVEKWYVSPPPLL